MTHEFLMYTASIMYAVCYIPDLASTYRNKNANIYNVPEKLFMLIGTSFALSYAVSINNNTLIINYTPSLILDSISLCLRVYYAYKNRNIDVSIKSQDNQSCQISSFDSGSSLNDIDYYTNVENPLHDNSKTSIDPY